MLCIQLLESLLWKKLFKHLSSLHLSSQLYGFSVHPCVSIIPKNCCSEKLMEKLSELTVSAYSCCYYKGLLRVDMTEKNTYNKIPAASSRRMLTLMRLALKQCSNTLYCHCRNGSCLRHVCSLASLLHFPSGHAVPSSGTAMKSACGMCATIYSDNIFWIYVTRVQFRPRLDKF